MTKSLALVMFYLIGSLCGYVYARTHPDYSDRWGYDKITRLEWHRLGWGTDPTEKPHRSGGFWCKAHIDMNGEACHPEFRPKQ